MIEFECECGKLLRVKDEMAGKKIRCPKCSRVSRVDLPAEPKPEPAPAPEEEQLVSFEPSDIIPDPPEPEFFSIPAPPEPAPVAAPPVYTAPVYTAPPIPPGPEQLDPPSRMFLQGIASAMFWMAMIGLVIGLVLIVVGIMAISRGASAFGATALVWAAGTIITSIFQAATSEVLMIFRSLEVQLYRIGNR